MHLSKKSFFDTNVKGFRRLLEISKQNKVKKIVLLSTVSVYGKIKTKEINISDLELEKASREWKEWQGKAIVLDEGKKATFSKCFFVSSP